MYLEVNMSHLLCAKCLHYVLLVNAVCWDEGGVLYGLGSWQKGIEEPLVCQVPLWGMKDGLTPALISCIRLACELHVAQRDGEALEDISLRKARLAAVPEPGGWQGVSHQCWPEGGRGARAQTEMWAELDAESTLNTKRTGNGKNALMARMLHGKTISWDWWEGSDSRGLIVQGNDKEVSSTTTKHKLNK